MNNGLRNTTQHRKNGNFCHSPILTALAASADGRTVADTWAHWLHHTCHLEGLPTLQSEGQNHHGSHVGRSATSPQPCEGSPTLQSKGQDATSPINPHHLGIVDVVIHAHQTPQEGIVVWYQANTGCSLTDSQSRMVAAVLLSVAHYAPASQQNAASWRTIGPIGYITPTVWGGYQGFKAGGKINSRSHVSGLAALPAI